MNPRPRKYHKSDPKFGLFIIISILFHAGILVFAMISSSRTARADLSLNSVYVKLMDPQQFPGFVKADAGPAPENGAQKKLEPPAKASKPAPEKQKADKIALPKDPTKEPLKKDSGKSESASLTDQEKKQLNDALSSIRSEVNRKQASGAEAEWQGIVGAINADMVKKAYYQRVVEVYKNSWTVPSSVPTDDANLRTRAVVRIDQNGRVMDYQFLSLSGNQDLDRSVSRLLDQVKQLPVPPAGLGADWISLPFSFTPFQEEP